MSNINFGCIPVHLEQNYEFKIHE